MTITASAVQRALARRVRALERDLPAVLDDDVEALHRSRVASRRLREILPVLGLERHPGRQTPVRKLRRRLRRLTSALGGVRELDVALGILDELRQRRPDLEQALSRARIRGGGRPPGVPGGDDQAARRARHRVDLRADVPPDRRRGAPVAGDARVTAPAEARAPGEPAGDGRLRCRVAVRARPAPPGPNRGQATQVRRSS